MPPCPAARSSLGSRWTLRRIPKAQDLGGFCCLRAGRALDPSACQLFRTGHHGGYMLSLIACPLRAAQLLGRTCDRRMESRTTDSGAVPVERPGPDRSELCPCQRGCLCIAAFVARFPLCHASCCESCELFNIGTVVVAVEFVTKLAMHLQ